LEELLQPIRERRAHYEQHIEEVYEILRRGSDEAREAAAATHADVRRAMRIDYFEDRELIERQAAEYRK
jgi:tryptophanyl-tRNA synthetase